MEMCRIHRLAWALYPYRNDELASQARATRFSDLPRSSECLECELCKLVVQWDQTKGGPEELKAWRQVEIALENRFESGKLRPEYQAELD